MPRPICSDNALLILAISQDIKGLIDYLLEERGCRHFACMYVNTAKGELKKVIMSLFKIIKACIFTSRTDHFVKRRLHEVIKFVSR